MITKKFIALITLSLLFLCLKAQVKKNTLEKTIKIGLLINDKEHLAANRGAALAVSLANNEYKNKGVHFELIVKSMEGPWGIGSKQAVDLIFDDQVWAILGSHSGRNAHLVEQVIAKTGIVFVSAWATDPTLAQAYVPWFFNCVSNDIQWSKAMVEFIKNQDNRANFTIITDETYDANESLKSFLKELKNAGINKPIQYSIKDDKNIKPVLTKIKKKGIEFLILFGNAQSNGTLIDEVKKINYTTTLLGGPALIGIDRVNENYINMRPAFGSTYSKFEKQYQEEYNSIPGAMAAFAYDGMNVLLQGIIASDFKQENIKTTISKSQFTGTSGDFEFDAHGNRKDDTKIFKIKNNNGSILAE